MKFINKNNINLFIILLGIGITLWYFYNTSYENFENVDDLVSAAGTCGDPKGCKTAEEISKEAEQEMNKKKQELAKPPSSPPDMRDITLGITIQNNNDNLKSINYNVPEIKAPSIAGTTVGPTVPRVINYKPILINEKLLSQTETDVYMLDVDPTAIGIIEESIYNIASVSVNHPDKKSSVNTFYEYIPRNHSLASIYKKKKEEIETRDVTVNTNNKYILKNNAKEQSKTLALDKAKPNNNFVIITPETNDTFPSNFTLTLKNDLTSNEVQLNLWNDNFLNDNKPKPEGNMNTILNKDTLSKYTENISRSVFGYNKEVFGDSCYKIDSDMCMIGGLNVGNRSINIMATGNVYDENNNVIGNVEKQSSTEDNQVEQYKININSENITGLILYYSYPA
jgi:hypothetical protein